MVGGPYLTYVTLTADNPLIIKFLCSFGFSGDGVGFAAGQCLLVLQDPQNGKMGVILGVLTLQMLIERLQIGEAFGLNI
ncbi:hypothetical protein BHE74_00018637 [Ensete ventricosum]|nr:hypothetical protein BHE74_00018637 [Ensete ventricosum]